MGFLGQEFGRGKEGRGIFLHGSSLYGRRPVALVGNTERLDTIGMHTAHKSQVGMSVYVFPC